MMKKFLVLLLVVFSVTLASCKKDEETPKRVDVPNADVVTELKLESVKNGKSIYEVDKTQSSYYDIKIAEEANSTLFVYNSMLDEIIEKKEAVKEKITEIHISPLAFTAEIYDNEKSELMTNVFGENGITKETLGVTFDLIPSTSWTQTISADDVVKDYVENAKRDNCVSIVYLPTYVEHVKDGKSILEVYVMIPVYYEITTYSNGSIGSQTFKDIAVPSIQFNENNLLPSN